MPAIPKPYQALFLSSAIPLSIPLSKRIFDILFSSCVLLLTAPLFLLISVAIRWSAPGPIFFKQPRLGQGGKVFICYKFRTMYPDAPSRLRSLLQSQPHLKIEWEYRQKLFRDPRVFPLGRFLRRTSLDELPQFLNVLIGDLSIVGPRPYTVAQRGYLKAFGGEILVARPGITGLWQTSGRSQTSFEERLRLDALYVQKQSFWLDLWLVIKTGWHILFLRHAC